VQDPATCVVAGMPGAAIARGVADFVGGPSALGERLSVLISKVAGAAHVC
jgi:chemotaxis response regulator CheB